MDLCLSNTDSCNLTNRQAKPVARTEGRQWVVVISLSSAFRTYNARAHSRGIVQRCLHVQWLLAVAGCRTLLSAPSCTTHGRTDCILPMVIQVRSVRNTGDFSSSRSIEMYFFLKNSLRERTATSFKIGEASKGPSFYNDDIT